MLGKSKDPNATTTATHTARPISSLKDPSSFGPPPKHTAYYSSSGSGSPVKPTSSDSEGLGAPIKLKEEPKEEETSKPAPPPIPYRANTTGLSTDTLPKPPVRRVDLTASPTQPSFPPATTKPKPGLPPRLPPRDAATSSAKQTTAPTPPASPGKSSYLSRSSISRLSSSGISVPALGITPDNSRSSPSTSPTKHLSSRFAAFPPNSSPADDTTTVKGTTLEEKKSALRTASTLRSDPSSVSIGDVRNAVTVGESFRARHGEQVAKGVEASSNLNNKYDLVGKMGKLSTAEERQAGVGLKGEEETRGAVEKKPPPPVPKKKVSVRLDASAGSSAGTAPPPVPLATKPR